MPPSTHIILYLQITFLQIHSNHRKDFRIAGWSAGWVASSQTGSQDRWLLLICTAVNCTMNQQGSLRFL